MEHRIFPACGESKRDQIQGGINENDWLLDDYTLNLNQWDPPGRGIKLLNGINHTKGTWKHEMVRHDKESLEIAENIVDIIRKSGTIKEFLERNQDSIKTGGSRMEQEKVIESEL